MYDAQELIRTLSKKPFTPLELRISTGETYEINHPEQAMVTPSDDVIIITPADEPGRHNWHLIGLDHVVGVHVSENAN